MNLTPLSSLLARTAVKDTFRSDFFSKFTEFMVGKVENTFIMAYKAHNVKSRVSLKDILAKYPQFHAQLVLRPHLKMSSTFKCTTKRDQIPRGSTGLVMEMMEESGHV